MKIQKERAAGRQGILSKPIQEDVEEYQSSPYTQEVQNNSNAEEVGYVLTWINSFLQKKLVTIIRSAGIHIPNLTLNISNKAARGEVNLVPVIGLSCSSVSLYTLGSPSTLPA